MLSLNFYEVLLTRARGMLICFLAIFILGSLIVGAIFSFYIENLTLALTLEFFKAMFLAAMVFGIILGFLISSDKNPTKPGTLSASEKIVYTIIGVIIGLINSKLILILFHSFASYGEEPFNDPHWIFYIIISIFGGLGHFTDEKAN